MPTATAVQPDIEYDPDEAKYRARVARNLAEDPDRVNVALPDGFPKRVDGPIVWAGSDWKSEDQWVYNLSSAQLDEIHAALEHFKSIPLDLLRMEPLS